MYCFLRFFGIVGSQKVHTLLDHLFHHLRIIDRPDIDFQFQIFCFNKPFRMFLHHLIIIVETGKTEFFQLFRRQVAVQVVDWSLRGQTVKLLCGFQTESDIFGAFRQFLTIHHVDYNLCRFPIPQGSRMGFQFENQLGLFQLLRPVQILFQRRKRFAVRKFQIFSAPHRRPFWISFPSILRSWYTTGTLSAVRCTSNSEPYTLISIRPLQRTNRVLGGPFRFPITAMSDHLCLSLADAEPPSVHTKEKEERVSSVS